MIFFSFGQGWWLLRNEVELSLLAAVANFCIFIIGYSCSFSRTFFSTICYMPIPCILTLFTILYTMRHTATWCSEELTSKNICSRRTPKLLYGENLPKSLGESYLHPATGKCTCIMCNSCNPMSLC